MGECPNFFGVYMVMKTSKIASTKTKRNSTVVALTCPNGNHDSKQSMLADEQLVKEFVTIWKTHESSDLEARHRLGTMLNKKFGNPKDRQGYGSGVMKRLSNETGLSISDLSLIRWLAVLGDSVSEIREKHPEIVNWTAFKRKARELKSKMGLKVQRAAKRNIKGSGLHIVEKALEQSLERLNSVDPTEVDGNEKSLLDLVRRIVKVMTKRFGFAVRLVEQK
jgi:hypothetical protein